MKVAILSLIVLAVCVCATETTSEQKTSDGSVYPFVEKVEEIIPEKRWQPDEGSCFEILQRLTSIKRHLKDLKDEKSHVEWKRLYKNYQYHCKAEKPAPVKRTTTYTKKYPASMPSYYPMYHPLAAYSYGSHPLAAAPYLPHPLAAYSYAPPPGSLPQLTGFGHPMTGGKFPMDTSMHTMPNGMPSIARMDTKIPSMPNPNSLYEKAPEGLGAPPKMPAPVYPEDHMMPPVDQMNNMAFPADFPDMPNPMTMYAPPPKGAVNVPEQHTPPPSSEYPENNQVPDLKHMERLAFPHMPELPSHDLSGPHGPPPRPISAMPISPPVAVPPPFSAMPLPPATVPVPGATSPESTEGMPKMPTIVPPWMLSHHEPEPEKPKLRHCEKVLKQLIEYKKKSPSTWAKLHRRRYIRVHARCYPEEHARIIKEKVHELNSAMHSIDKRLEAAKENIVKHQDYDPKEELDKSKDTELVLRKILWTIQGRDQKGEQVDVKALNKPRCDEVLSQLLRYRQGEAVSDGDWGKLLGEWKGVCFNGNSENKEGI